MVVHLGVVVADSSIVELLCPSCLGIHLCHASEEAILILAHLMVGKALSAEGLGEDGLYLRIGVFLVVELLDTMVGELASVLGEEVMTLLKSINHILECIDVNIGYGCQLLYIIGKLRLLDVHGLVGTPCGYHLNLKTTLACLLVITKVVNGIVGGAHTLHVVVAHQSTG